MSRFPNLSQTFRVHIPDDNGYIGRECPVEECLGYFKVTPGTGSSENTTCRCPYCGHEADNNEFWTQEQLAYLRSVAVKHIQGALKKDFGAIASSLQPRGSRGLIPNVRLKLNHHPIRYYEEKQLETEVVCDRCKLRYAIYGVFGYCPDCGVHNSAQVFGKNLELFERMLALASGADATLGEHLLGNALEDAVAAFDGFGREACRMNAHKASAPEKVEKMSFQNLTGARDRVRSLFGFDFADSIGPTDWELAVRCFQKRHLLSHRMGVVDHDYVKATGDRSAVLGRKVRIDRDEVSQLFTVLKALSAALVAGLEATAP